MDITSTTNDFIIRLAMYSIAIIIGCIIIYRQNKRDKKKAQGIRMDFTSRINACQESYTSLSKKHYELQLAYEKLQKASLLIISDSEELTTKVKVLNKLVTKLRTTAKSKLNSVTNIMNSGIGVFVFVTPEGDIATNVKVVTHVGKGAVIGKPTYTIRRKVDGDYTNVPVTPKYIV